MSTYGDFANWHQRTRIWIGHDQLMFIALAERDASHSCLMTVNAHGARAYCFDALLCLH